MPKFAAGHLFCHSFSNLRYPPSNLPPLLSRTIHGLLSVATGVNYFLNISSSNIENISSSDQVSARTLPYLTSVTGQLTVESCLNACQASGYPLAGVEYGSQCC
jgi:WSC domain